MEGTITVLCGTITNFCLILLLIYFLTWLLYKVSSQDKRKERQRNYLCGHCKKPSLLEDLTKIKCYRNEYGDGLVEILVCDPCTEKEAKYMVGDSSVLRPEHNNIFSLTDAYKFMFNIK